MESKINDALRYIDKMYNYLYEKYIDNESDYISSDAERACTEAWIKGARCILDEIYDILS